MQLRQNPRQQPALIYRVPENIRKATNEANLDSCKQSNLWKLPVKLRGFQSESEIENKTTPSWSFLSRRNIPSTWLQSLNREYNLSLGCSTYLYIKCKHHLFSLRKLNKVTHGNKTECVKIVFLVWKPAVDIFLISQLGGDNLSLQVAMTHIEYLIWIIFPSFLLNLS